MTQVKNNQKTLLKQIQHGCQRQNCFHKIESSWEKRHGRLEKRIYELFNPLPMLEKWQDDWKFIQQVIRVTRHRERLHSSRRMSQEVSYYVCNRELPIQLISNAIRQHWAIENKLHYVKDVAFHEDKTRKYVKPEIFSTLIDMALNRIRAENKENVKGALFENSTNVIKTITTYCGLNSPSTP